EGARVDALVGEGGSFDDGRAGVVSGGDVSSTRRPAGYLPEPPQRLHVGEPGRHQVRAHGPRGTAVQLRTGGGRIKADLVTRGPQATPERECVGVSVRRAVAFGLRAEVDGSSARSRSRFARGGRCVLSAERFDANLLRCGGPPRARRLV